MKIKFCLLNLLYISILFNFNIQAAKSSKKAITYINEDLEVQQAIYAPINFTPEGVRSYLCHGFNRPEYAQEILPNSLDHFIQFLQHGKKTQQNRAYIKSAVKLFYNKLNAAPCMNGFVFASMLEQLPGLIKEYFLITRTDTLGEAHKAAINDILYNNFLSRYDMFKNKTQDFFDLMSQEIVDVMHSDLNELQETATILELRQTIIKFLDKSLSKLVWSPEDHKKVWECFKKISIQLEVLLDQGIIDDINDLDDLYWTLIHRFCFFLDLSSEELPVQFYEQVKNSIATENLLILELEEQEPLIQAKGKVLINTIIDAHAKKAAQEIGIKARA